MFITPVIIRNFIGAFSSLFMYWFICAKYLIRQRNLNWVTPTYTYDVDMLFTCVYRFLNYCFFWFFFKFYCVIVLLLRLWCCSLGIFTFIVNKNVIIKSNSNIILFISSIFTFFVFASPSNETFIPKYFYPRLYIEFLLKILKYFRAFIIPIYKERKTNRN